MEKNYGQELLERQPPLGDEDFVEALETALYAKIDQSSLAGLTSPELSAYLVLYANAQVLNGGLIQLYLNSGVGDGGDGEMERTILAFGQMGLKERAEILEATFPVFQKLYPAWDWDQENGQTYFARDSLFLELTEKWYSLEDSRGAWVCLGKALRNYVKNNLDFFTR